MARVRCCLFSLLSTWYIDSTSDHPISIIEHLPVRVTLGDRTQFGGDMRYIPVTVPGQVLEETYTNESERQDKSWRIQLSVTMRLGCRTSVG